MSSRTSESNKAIRIAWNNEQKLVREGKATREWTPKQQRDILDRGKAYDDDGRAFEGQHMMSVEKYPEYQGNPENIQFLTREEHLEAHDGSWQNQTSWYYNPNTKEKVDFSNGNFKPCEIIDLCNAIVRQQVDQVAKEGTSQELVVETSKKNSTEKITSSIAMTSGNSSEKSKQSIQQRMGETLRVVYEKGNKFKDKHPKMAKTISKVVVVTGTVVVSHIYREIKNKLLNSKYDRINDYYDEYESLDKIDYSITEDNTESIERSSPDKHNVRSHGQHYNTKEGRIWKEKEAYLRGDGKEE